ncbi:MAG: DNRLRE domain-containing protein [Bacteroidota bacterium]
MKHKLHFALILSLIIGFSPAFAQDTLSIVADRDNSLYESGTGDVSNGSGGELFIGRIDRSSNFLRRALIHFDLSAIPAGATIDSVSLSLFVSRSAPGSGNQPASLHKMLSDWGEGASNAGLNGGLGDEAENDDATWVHTFSPSSTWNTPGGDFEATATVNTTLGLVGAYTVSGGTMVDDIQGWVDDSTTNFGWVILGNENMRKSAKKLDSREGNFEERKPTLTVFYTENTTNIEDLEAVSLKVYPNPSSDGKISIEIEGLTVGSLTMNIVNIIGKELLEEELTVSGGRIDRNIDLSSWGPGLYFLQFQTKSGTRTHKIVVK